MPWRVPFKVAGSALMPSGSQVRLRAGDNRLVVWYLDPFGADFTALAKQMGAAEGRLYSGLTDEAQWLERHRLLLAEDATPAQGYGVIEQLVGATQTLPFKLDPRISSVVALIKRDVANNLSAGYLAAQMDLSAPHLSQHPRYAAVSRAQSARADTHVRQLGAFQYRHLPLLAGLGGAKFAGRHLAFCQGFVQLL